MLGDVNSDQPEALLERLKGIFDIVRLVDPESTKVLGLGKDGRLTEMPGTCHMAVSYTHLDVYKRQTLHLGSPAWVLPRPCFRQQLRRRARRFCAGQMCIRDSYSSRCADQLHQITFRKAGSPAERA